MAELSEEKKQKNLANCTLPEFVRQANKIRHAAHDYYETLDISGIRDRIKAEYANADDVKKSKLTKRFISDILDAMLDTNAEKTVEIIGMASFKTPEEAMQMSVGEAFDVVSNCLSSKRVMDFFINAVKLGLTDTDDILQKLNSLVSKFSEKNTSDSTS